MNARKLLVVALVCLLTAWAAAGATISLSAVAEGGYAQSVAVRPGETALLAVRAAGLHRLAWWSVTLDKRYEGDPACEFVTVRDGLPGWIAATSGRSAPPERYYLANSLAWSPALDYTGDATVAYIEVRPKATTTISLAAWELVDGDAGMVPTVPGATRVTITVGKALVGDVNGDGCVNITDLMLVRANLGAGCE